MAELILALDLPTRDKALALIDQLKNHITWCKVGLELFTRCGPPLLAELKERQQHIFLDLKFYDIPHTVGRAVAQAIDLGIDLLTLHCQGGKRMLAAAVASVEEKKAQGRCRLFGVTALTSFAEGEMPGISQPPSRFAVTLADLAASAGLDGIVCSVQELRAMKERHPELRCLCPGIRPAWAARGDQRRVASPKEAVAAGADFLVVGRPILEAADPLCATQKILEEMVLS